MRQAFKLLVLRERLLARHWSTGEWLGGILAAAVAAALYLLARGFLTGVNPAAGKLAGAGLTAGIFLIGLVFTAANFSRSWFSPADAFYLAASPLSFNERYSFHYLDTVLRFFKHFGHLVLPVSLAVGAVVGGWTGVLILLGAGLLSVGLAVALGFLYMFFVFSGAHLLRRAGGGVLTGLAIAALAVWIGWVSPTASAVMGLLLIIMVFRLTPAYARSVLHKMEAPGSSGFIIQVATPWQRCLEKAILYNRFLQPGFRAFLYREVATDARNMIFLGKYVIGAAMLFLYWPLQQIDMIAESGMAGALIFCYLVFITSICESFITTYAKEGDRIVFLLPAFHSWKKVGLAKFGALVLEILPLLPVAVLVVGSRWNWSTGDILAFTISLFMMTALHLAVTVVLSAGLLSLENLNFTLWEGMVYEQILGYFEPRILRRFMLLQTVPFLLIAALWVLHTVFPIQFTALLWCLNLVMASLVAGIMFAGERAFSARLAVLFR